MEKLDVVINILEWMQKMIPVGIALIFFFVLGIFIHNVVVEKRAMPWEKEERKNAERRKKEEIKARRDFWAGKRV